MQARRVAAQRTEPLPAQGRDFLHGELRGLIGETPCKELHLAGPDTSAIEREIQEYILREFLPGEKPENLTESTPLISGGVLDSIGMLKLVKHLEDNYQLEVEAHEVDVENFDTIALIANFVRAKKPGG